MVSICVPVWNHFEDLTEPFIKQLEENTRGVEYELIVVNNGSKDGTYSGLKKLQKKYFNLKVINSPENLGFGGGNNLGFEKAKGDYICFISNDVIIRNPDWLKVLIAKINENPKTLTGPQYVTWNDLTRFRNQITPYIAGWCMFATKKLFNEIAEDKKVFDEQFGKAYFEDVDVSIRAVFKGFTLSGTVCGLEHLGSKSSDQIDISKTTKIAQQHFYNKMTWMHLEKEKKKRIVFYFESTYPFVDPDYEGKGVGGAEASLILFARELAKKGFQVEIYNATKLSGKFNGVEYYNYEDFRPTDYCDVFILFRVPYEKLEIVNAVVKIFWSCDQYTAGYWQLEIFPFVDKVVAISPYHASYVEKIYGPLGDKLVTLELGINAEDYRTEVEKVPGKIIFCSVPRRGLNYLAKLFPEIRRRVPEASLYITSDYTLWGLDSPDNHEFVAQFNQIEGVFFLGKVTRPELVRHQLEAEVMAYPCFYEECFCIAAMECMAAGAVPVTTALAALNTTVNTNGILLSNMPGNPEYDKKFVDSVTKLLKEKPYAQNIRDKSRTRALKEYSWEQVTKNWLELFFLIENQNQKMVKCKKENCKKEFENGYQLAKHEAKYHNDAKEFIPINNPNQPPKEKLQLVRFTRKVEFQINSRRFEGTEIEIPVDMVSSAIDMVMGAYGKDILEI